MATRSGSLDPGLLLHLLASGIERDELDEALNHRSGLLGIAGLAGLREVEHAATRRRRARAARARRVRARRQRRRRRDDDLAARPRRARLQRGRGRALGAAARRDLRAPRPARRRRSTTARNAQHAEQIAAAGAPVAVLVVPAGEEIVIARETASVLAAGPAPARRSPAGTASARA